MLQVPTSYKCLSAAIWPISHPGNLEKQISLVSEDTDFCYTGFVYYYKDYGKGNKEIKAEWGEGVMDFHLISFLRILGFTGDLTCSFFQN